MVSRDIAGFATTGEAKTAAYKEAGEWCAAHGLVFVPVSSDFQDPKIGSHMGHFDLFFRALRPGDQEIHRTQIEAPNSIQRIEYR